MSVKIKCEAIMESQLTVPDTQTQAAVLAFKARLERRYGSHLKGLYLFGSRARGDHRPDSDADLAVVLDHVSDFVDEGFLLDEEVTPVLLEHGIYVQAWPFEEEEWKDPAKSKTKALLMSATQEGIPV